MGNIFTANYVVDHNVRLTERILMTRGGLPAAGHKSAAAGRNHDRCDPPYCEPWAKIYVQKLTRVAVANDLCKLAGGVTTLFFTSSVSRRRGPHLTGGPHF